VPEFDAVGIGLNATDRLILVPRFPAYGGKVRYREEFVSTGGEAATAMAACAALGLRTSYIGSVGDDEFGRIQIESLRRSGVDIDHILHRKDCPNQSAYIVIDQTTGERTVFARRPDPLAIDPSEIPPDLITSARLLHLDGHNTEAVAFAASVARRHGIPVTMDVDTVYRDFEKVLPNVDFLISSAEFPAAWTGCTDPFQALAEIQKEYRMEVAAMTLGAGGSLARASGRFIHAPGYVVECLDTTGAGDVFHGAFCYSVLQGWPLLQSLEFSNAMAALNCTAYGARGGLRRLDEIAAFQKRAQRHPAPDFLRGLR
jgi:sulfofructose kinase